MFNFNILLAVIGFLYDGQRIEVGLSFVGCDVFERPCRYHPLLQESERGYYLLVPPRLPFVYAEFLFRRRCRSRPRSASSLRSTFYKYCIVDDYISIIIPSSAFFGHNYFCFYFNDGLPVFKHCLVLLLLLMVFHDVGIDVSQ